MRKNVVSKAIDDTVRKTNVVGTHMFPEKNTVTGTGHSYNQRGPSCDISVKYGSITSSMFAQIYLL